MRQAINHFDCVMLQDTHIDGKISPQVSKEWNGSWAFANNRSNKGGVATYINDEKKAQYLINDSEAYDNGKGSIIGRTIQAGPIKLYL